MFARIEQNAESHGQAPIDGTGTVPAHVEHVAVEDA